MIPAMGRELAKIRVGSLLGDGGGRASGAPGRLRKALGHGFIGAGQRLLGARPRSHVIRLGERGGRGPTRLELCLSAAALGVDSRDGTDWKGDRPLAP